MALLVEYGFNEGSGGTVFDTSGGGKNGTPTGTPWGAPGHGGTAAAFAGDGVADKSISVPVLGAGRMLNFTIMFWANPTDSGVLSTALSAQGSLDGIAVSIDQGATDAWSFPWQYSGTPRPALYGAWHHYAVVVTQLTGTTWSFVLYEDGVSVVTDTQNYGGDGVLLPYDGTLLIGRGISVLRPLAGMLDDLRIYDTALGQAAVVAGMNTPVGAGAPPAPSVYAQLSNTDLELRYLKTVKGATRPSLLDCRLEIYGENDQAYFAALSGLAPAGKYTLADHQLAYYRARTSTSTLSLADTARLFWADQIF